MGRPSYEGCRIKELRGYALRNPQLIALGVDYPKFRAVIVVIRIKVSDCNITRYHCGIAV